MSNELTTMSFLHSIKILAPFACLKFGLFDLFFQSEQCFSLTTIQPEQCFSASFSQSSDQRMGPMYLVDRSAGSSQP